MRKWIGLALLVFIVFAFRLYFSFSTPFMSEDTAYLYSRLSDFSVSMHDDLSWGGSSIFFNKFWVIILSTFSLLFKNLLVMKALPNLLASLIVIPFFFISYDYTKSYWTSLGVASIAAFLPVFFINTINHASVLSLAIPLYFWVLYCWMRLPSVAWARALAVSIVLLAFLHPISLILILSIFLFLLFCFSEKMGVSSADSEMLIFSSAFVLWAQSIIFKPALVVHGLSVFWQNIPSDLIAQFFSSLNFFDILWQVGFFPLFIGSFVLYKTAFKVKERSTYIIFANTIVVFVLLWFRIIDFFSGLMLLGLLLVLLLPKGFVFFQDFIKSTKFNSLSNVFTFFIFITILFTVLAPSIAGSSSVIKSTITIDEYYSLEWLRENSQDGAVVIAPVYLGHAVSKYASRPNVIDSNFYLHKDAESVFYDVDRVFSSVLETEVVEIFDKYDASYVLIPEGFSDYVFANSDCFSLLFENKAKVYYKDPSCRLRVVS